MRNEVVRALHLRQSGAADGLAQNCKVSQIGFSRSIRGQEVAAKERQSAPTIAIAVAAAALWQIICIVAGGVSAQAADGKVVLSLAQAVKAGPPSLQAVAWSPSGKQLAVASALPETQIWDARDLRPLRVLPEGMRAFTALARRDIAYGGHGNLLLAGYSTATIWATSTWQPKLSLIGPAATDPRRFGIHSLAFSSDQRRVIAAYDTLPPQTTPPIIAFDAKDGSVAWSYKLKSTLGTPPRITTGLHPLANSSAIAFGTFETLGGPTREVRRFSQVVILNTDTGALIRSIAHVHVDRITAMAVSDDGRWIATGTTTGTREESYNISARKLEVMDNRDPLRIWDSRSGALIKELPVHSYVWALAFSCDRHYIFEVEAVSRGHEVLNVWDLADSALVQSLPTPRVDNEVTALASSPDGEQVAAVGTGIAIYEYRGCK